MTEASTPTNAAPFHAGTVAIVGRPNVGKSTLFNALVGQKLAITSSKAQTTRHALRGVLTTETAQFVFVDTPGLQFQHKGALYSAMNRNVDGALDGVDVAVFVIEAYRWLDEDQAVLTRLPAETPVILALNKVDRADRELLFAQLQTHSQRRNFAALVPVSAEKRTQTSALLKEIERALPIQPPLYTDDELTDRSERFLAAEFIREKLFRLLGDELPYQTAVVIEKFELEGALRRIEASIIVDKDSQKAIVIGKGGVALKRIGTEARVELEKLFQGPVYLNLWVKVKGGWADSQAQLRSMGFDDA